MRLRLTALYGALFLLSGAALMAISYALLVNAGFVFTLDNGSASGLVTGSPSGRGRAAPPLVLPVGLPIGATTHPSAATMAHWRDVAVCMREHGVSRFPDPVTSVPANFRVTGGEVSDHDGALFPIPATINMKAAAFTGPAAACGFIDAYQSKLYAENNSRRAQVRETLLIQSGIALAGMSLLSLGLGWLMAGRVLQPLEDAYRAQRQFVANASHELRAPLTRLRALSEVALASPAANFASLRAAHERVLASEQHLEQLIDGLLVLARGHAGLERRDPLDLASLASQAMLAHGLQLAGPELDVRATLDAAPVVGDPRLLERLVANLLDNAIRHNVPRGHLELATGTRERHAFLAVANSGPTIAPEEIERLWQPFERLEGARTRHDAGQGLGLSIVKAIADAHQAQLVARARPEGGLAVEVSFPAATGEHSVDAAFAPQLDSMASLLDDAPQRAGFALGGLERPAAPAKPDKARAVE